MTTPAYLGAMSMWLTLKPPREKPSVPIVRLVAATPDGTPRASGIASSAPIAASMPARARGRSGRREQSRSSRHRRSSVCGDGGGGVPAALHTTER